MKELNNKINCTLCNTKITRCNWARHIKSLKHQRNDPNQTIPPRKRGRPKTKPDRRKRDVTRKDLVSQVRRYNIKGCTRMSKEQLLPILSKVKKLFYKKD
jgi:hypothetical protein